MPLFQDFKVAKSPFYAMLHEEKVRSEPYINFDKSKKALSAFDAMRQSLADSNTPQMSLEEINAEIKAARNARREKNLRSH